MTADQGVRPPKWQVELELAALRALHQAVSEKTVVTMTFTPDGFYVVQPLSPEILIASIDGSMPGEHVASIIAHGWYYERWQRKYHPQTAREIPRPDSAEAHAELELMIAGVPINGKES